MRTVHVLNVDDQAIVREGLKSMFGDRSGVEVVAEVEDAAGAIATIPACDADVVLLDMDLAHEDGLPALHRIGERFPEIPVVVLTTSDEPGCVEAAVRAGARGYLLKNAGREELIRALRAAVAGNVYLQPEVTRPLLTRFARDVRDVHARGHGGPSLSQRETDVVTLASRGLANKQIAAALGLSETTVKGYLHQVYEKLGAADRAHAVATALRNRLIE